MSGGSRLSDLEGTILNHHTGISCMSLAKICAGTALSIILNTVHIEILDKNFSFNKSSVVRFSFYNNKSTPETI